MEEVHLVLRVEGLSFVEAYLQVVRHVLEEVLLVVDQEEPLLVEDRLCT